MKSDSERKHLKKDILCILLAITLARLFFQVCNDVFQWIVKTTKCKILEFHTLLLSQATRYRRFCKVGV